MKLRFATDWNGTIAGTREGARAYLMHTTGAFIPPECQRRQDIVGRAFRLVTGGTIVFDEARYKRLMDDFYAGGVFMEWIKPLPYATAVLHMLRKSGCLISIVSNIRSMKHAAVIGWLEKHGIGDVPLTLTFEKGKTETYAAHDVAVDDEFENLEPLFSAQKKPHLLWMISARAAEAVCHPVIPVFSWLDIEAHVVKSFAA